MDGMGDSLGGGGLEDNAIGAPRVGNEIVNRGQIALNEERRKKQWGPPKIVEPPKSNKVTYAKVRDAHFVKFILDCLHVKSSSAVGK